MTKEPPKILEGFTLLPEGRKRLEHFFAAHFDALRRSDADAQQELQSLLREVLPLQSQERLKEIFSGTSDSALLIHGLPERKGLEKWAAEPKPQDTYSYFIGNAIHAMNGAVPKKTDLLVRHATDSISVIGGFLHRDYPYETPYVVFSSPYNGENAFIGVTNLEKAISSIPESDREKTIVKVSGYSGPDVKKNLNELLVQIREPAMHGIVTRISMFNVSDPAEMKLRRSLVEAVDRHSVKVNLQPGDLLFMDEDHMFHRAYRGDASAIPPRNFVSRILVRNAAAHDTQER
jgi:hypothetical protein